MKDKEQALLRTEKTSPSEGKGNENGKEGIITIENNEDNKKNAVHEESYEQLMNWLNAIEPINFSNVDTPNQVQIIHHTCATINNLYNENMELKQKISQVLKRNQDNHCATTPLDSPTDNKNDEEASVSSSSSSIEAPHITTWYQNDDNEPNIYSRKRLKLQSNKLKIDHRKKIQNDNKMI